MFKQTNKPLEMGMIITSNIQEKVSIFFHKYNFLLFKQYLYFVKAISMNILYVHI